MVSPFSNRHSSKLYPPVAVTRKLDCYIARHGVLVGAGGEVIGRTPHMGPLCAPYAPSMARRGRIEGALWAHSESIGGTRRAHTGHIEGSCTADSGRLCALYGPSTHPLCAHYAPSMSPPCVLCTPSMHPVCALYAPSMCPLWTHYVPPMCPLCALCAPSDFPRFPGATCIFSNFCR